VSIFFRHTPSGRLLESGTVPRMSDGLGGIGGPGHPAAPDPFASIVQRFNATIEPGPLSYLGGLSASPAPGIPTGASDASPQDALIAALKGLLSPSQPVVAPPSPPGLPTSFLLPTSWYPQPSQTAALAAQAQAQVAAVAAAAAAATPNYPTQEMFSSLSREEQLQLCLRGIALGEPAKYKTRMCRNWVGGYCEYGLVCVFAHGHAELRPTAPVETTSKRPSRPDSEESLVKLQQDIMAYAAQARKDPHQPIAGAAGAHGEPQILIALPLLLKIMQEANISSLDIPEGSLNPGPPYPAVVATTDNPLRLAIVRPSGPMDTPTATSSASAHIEKPKRGRKPQNRSTVKPGGEWTDQSHW